MQRHKERQREKGVEIERGEETHSEIVIERYRDNVTVQDLQQNQYLLENPVKNYDSRELKKNIEKYNTSHFTSDSTEK